MLPVNVYRLVLISISLLLINACASPPKPHYSVNARSHQAQLQELKHWQIRGKLAFRSPQDKFSANMHWQQQQDHFRLNLSSFLGTNILLLEKRLGRVELHYDDEVYRHTDAALLLYELLGWNLPVESISQWIKGQASPTTRAEFADSGLVNRIQTQDGWVVSLSDYRQTQDVLLPHLVRLQAGPHQIKIRIDTWQLN